MCLEGTDLIHIKETSCVGRRTKDQEWALLEMKGPA